MGARGVNMMKTLLLTLTLTVSVYAATDVMQNPSYSFEDYLAEFSKAYPTSAQLLHRAKIFEANLEQIRAQNSFTGATWTAGLNEFTDWSNEEFKAQRTGTKKPIASELYRAPLLGNSWLRVQMRNLFRPLCQSHIALSRLRLVGRLETSLSLPWPCNRDPLLGSLHQ